MTPVVLIYLILGYQYSKNLQAMTNIYFVFYTLHTAIIMPTIWEYVVDKFGAQEWVYSLSISCSSLANILFGPLFGALYDKTHATKVLVTLTIASSAIGMRYSICKCMLPINHVEFHRLLSVLFCCLSLHGTRGAIHARYRILH